MSPNNLTEVLHGIRRIHHSPQALLPLHAPVFAGRESAYVQDTLNSTFVSSVGAYVDRFEALLQQITGARHAVACVNGTSALQVALHLAGVKPGDLVITQSLSFVATANAIRHAGATPVFVDVEQETLGLSPPALQQFLDEHCRPGPHGPTYIPTGQRIAACVPMHSFGLPCRILDILALCEERDIPVVEDAAEALGSLYHGQHCGLFGKVGILSFNGNKICTTGGGGALLTNDETLGTLGKHLTTTAKLPHAWEFRHDAVAWNFRLPNLNAALGCAQLEQLWGFVDEKRALAQEYAELFAATDWTLIQEPEHSRSNYWLCAVLTCNRTERDALLEAGQTAGIILRPVWEPLHTLPMYATCPRGALRVTLDVAARLVNLPSGVRRA